MPDISMCKNKKCTQRLMCYRYMAMPNPYRQAYMDFEQEGNICASFMDIYTDHAYMMHKYHEELSINQQKPESCS